MLAAVYSDLGINMALLFDMYVPSCLMSHVCSLGSKGQVFNEFIIKTS